MTPTLPQTIALLQLSRGKPPTLAPMTRRVLLRRGWIHPSALSLRYEITDAGRSAMATSPHLTLAQREVDTPTHRQVPSGYASDRVKRSVRR